MSLEARPENAALAREAVADAVSRVGLGDRLVDDAKVVVTEGFTNATRHGYAGWEGGHVLVEALTDPGGVTIVVRDRGEGFRPRVPDARRVSGLGIGLIAALSERVELRRLREGGTEVRARLEGRSGERPH